jgi:hypothetical protein
LIYNVLTPLSTVFQLWGDPGIGTFLFPGILKITWGIPEECVKNYAINNLDPHLQ